MIRGLYISGTSMIENNRRTQAVSNNIANVETVAFKRDDVTVESFHDVLISKFNGSRHTVEGPLFKVEDKITKDGHKVSTDNGFFRIQTDSGLSHNKEVYFDKDLQGYLSTYYLNSDRTKNWNMGNRLIGASGKPIHVGANNYEIKKNGEVVVNGSVVDNLVNKGNTRVIGTLNGGVKTTRVVIDFKQGQLRRTDRSMDLSLDGKGFFIVKTPAGEAFTRDGQFKMGNNKKIVTAEGYPVQGFDGDIVIDSTNVSINEYGEIIYKNKIIDKFKTISVTNEGDLKRMGGGYYRLRDKPVGTTKKFEGKIRQGFVEQSNSHSITEMIHLISLQRNYEANQKVIQTHDTLLGKVINEVGRIK